METVMREGIMSVVEDHFTFHIPWHSEGEMMVGVRDGGGDAEGRVVRSFGGSIRQRVGLLL